MTLVKRVFAIFAICAFLLAFCFQWGAVADPAVGQEARALPAATAIKAAPFAAKPVYAIAPQLHSVNLQNVFERQQLRSKHAYGSLKAVLFCLLLGLGVGGFRAVFQCLHLVEKRFQTSQLAQNIGGVSPPISI